MSTDINMFYDDVFDCGSLTAANAIINAANNVINHGNTAGRGPGPSQQLYLVISIDETFSGATGSLTFALIQSAAVGMGTPTTLATYTASAVTAPAGEVVAQVALPTITQQFTRINVGYTGTATTGQFSAYLTTDPQANES